MKGQRGAVVVETALTAGIGLTILLFSIQVGVLGFLQVTADAASFVSARGSAIGTLASASPAAVAHAAFPQIAIADVTVAASPSPAPSAPLAIDYEYNTGNNYGGVLRHSGESLLQPLQIPVSVAPHSKIGFLGKLMRAGASDVEAQWVECTPHFNAADTLYQQCGLTGNGGNPTGYFVNYFTSGENTPMYYVGFDFMQQCAQAMPWSACPSGNTQFLALGMGSFLDTDNWGVTTPGVNGPNQYYNAGPGGKGVPPNQTFEWLACHYDRFADLAFFFSHYPDLPMLYSGSAYYGVGGYGGQIDNFIYGLGVTGLGSGPKPTNFKNITSFYSAVLDPGADASIQQIYSWDVTLPKSTPINGTEPGTNSAYVTDAGQGC